MKKHDKYPFVLKTLLKFYPDAVSELRFHPVRMWRMDFAVPSLKLGIEIDGGVWSGGRHSGGAGQIADMEKGNAAIILGWRVLHYTPQQIKTGKWIDDVHLVSGIDDHG